MAGNFWGLSTEGKEARGYPRQFGFASDQQYKDWLARQNQFGTRGNYFGDQIRSYWNARSQEPQPGVADVRATGESILPFQPALDRRAGRFEDMLANYGSGVTPADTTGGRMRGYLDEAGGNISRSGDILSGEINEGAKRQIDQSDAGYNDIISNLIKQSGGLRGFFDQGFSGIKDIVTGGYGEAQKALDMTRPGGDLRAATTARAFAPQKANVMRRLIASGVDPNSPEGVAALSNVGEQQARAMDDTLGTALDRYGDKAMGLALGKSGALADVTQAGLGASAGVERDLMSAVPGLQRAGLTSRLGIEDQRQRDAFGNVREQRDLSNQLLDTRGKQEQLQRAMQTQDWDAVNSIVSQMNEDELRGLDLSGKQFGMGGNFLDWQQGRADMPYDRLAQLSEQDLQDMFRSGQMARGFGGDAYNAFADNYAQEAQNAGWGTKLLSGVGGAALNMFAPGAGTALSAGIGGLSNLFKRRDNTGMPRGYIYGGG